MTIRDPIVIGEIVTVQNGETARSAIEIWHGYGVVCHKLGTHNGDRRSIAKSLAYQPTLEAYHRRSDPSTDYSIKVTLGDAVLTGQSEQEIFEMLERLYAPHAR